MAWIDDRVWCHPKLVEVSDKAFRVWVTGIAYSTGFQTRGHLTPGQQKVIGTTTKARSELVTAGLWHENGNGIAIHDWDDHNGRRDAKRAANRERKRRQRERERHAAVTRDNGVTTPVTSERDGAP